MLSSLFAKHRNVLSVCLTWWIVLATAGTANGQQVPAAWLNRAPGAAEAEAIVRGAEAYGWPAMAEALREAAFGLHRRNQLGTAEAWLYAALWAELFDLNEHAEAERWARAIRAAGVPHSMTAAVARPVLDQPLRDRWPASLQREVLANREFSAAFFDLRQPVDYLPGVFQILAELWQEAGGAGWGEHGQLALALALVYDVPPPRGWPHGQVSEQALPRQLPDPVEAWRFFTRAEGGRRFLHNLARLGAAELKFVVDLAAPFEELRWAQRMVTSPLGSLGATYSEIRYDHDRFRGNRFQWEGTDYRLEEIRRRGGICVDQAYFATQAGKARGVPTLYFRGAGLDGRHAWFGYLDGSGRWRLDEGRYAEQRYVIGFAHDPQTWADISDYEVQFLTEGFRRTTAYRESRVNGLFAEALMAVGRLDDAERAARRATNAERRNLAAWETLLEINHRREQSGRPREDLLREAATAMRVYVDLYARFMSEAADSLRARGETAAADREEEALARRFRTQRSDLTMQLASNMMERAMRESGPAEQMVVYQRILRLFGQGAGMELFDSVVRPWMVQLVTAGHQDEARRALELARRTLNPPNGSQMDMEMQAWSARLR